MTGKSELAEQCPHRTLHMRRGSNRAAPKAKRLAGKTRQHLGVEPAHRFARTMGACEKSRGSRLRFSGAVLAPIPPDKESSSGRGKRPGEEQSCPSGGFALAPAKSQLVQGQIQRQRPANAACSSPFRPTGALCRPCHVRHPQIAGDLDHRPPASAGLAVEVSMTNQLEDDVKAINAISAALNSILTRQFIGVIRQEA